MGGVAGAEPLTESSHLETGLPPSDPGLVTTMRSSPQRLPPDTGGPPAALDRALVDLLADARAGDGRAWERLYERFTPMLRAIARSYRLSASDVDDVVQVVWLRLLSNIGRLREPAAVGGWLRTTACRECLMLRRAPARELLSDDPALGDRAEPLGAHDPESVLLATERRDSLSRVLAEALAMLPERHRKLMTLLASESALDYRAVSVKLAMPLGSIGPTRARSIARLQRHPELLDLCLSAG
jgi:RNA polymerase sigma factor (sigma-70 family)